MEGLAPVSVPVADGALSGRSDMAASTNPRRSSWNPIGKCMKNLRINTASTALKLPMKHFLRAKPPHRVCRFPQCQGRAAAGCRVSLVSHVSPATLRPCASDSFLRSLYFHCLPRLRPPPSRCPARSRSRARATSRRRWSRASTSSCCARRRTPSRPARSSGSATAARRRPTPSPSRRTASTSRKSSASWTRAFRSRRWSTSPPRATQPSSRRRPITRCSPCAGRCWRA